MAPELGVFAFILAFVLSLSQAFFGLAGAWRGKPVWMAVARPAVTGQFVFVAIAFGCLVYASCTTISRCCTWRTIRTRSCRCSIRWRLCGARTRVRCCCGF